MPIFPRYNVPQSGVPTARTAVPAADTTFGDIFSGLGKIGQRATSELTEVALKKQKLEDTTLMADRMRRAELDIDATIAGLKSAKDSHAQAPQAFEAQITKISEGWTQGMQPEAVAVFQKELTPRIIAGMRQARALKDQYLIDDAKATFDVTSQAFIDRASRLDVSDTDALADAPKFQEYLDSLVSTTAMSREAAVSAYQKLLDSAAYARLQRMTVSDNPQRALDILNEEEKRNGSTFAKLIAPKERNTLRADAQGRVHALKMQIRQDDDYLRVAQERTVNQLRESTENMFEAQLDAGELRVADVEHAASLQLLTSEKQRYFKAAIEKRNVEGKDDPATYRSLSARYVDINEDPRRVEADVERAYANGLLSRTSMVQMKSHLQSWQKALMDQGRSEARADAKDFIKAQHGQVEQVMRASLVSGESSIMRQLAEPVLASALEELGKTSAAMVPGGVNPWAFWDANKNRFLSAAGASGAKMAMTQRSLLPAPYREIQHVDELKADPGFSALPRLKQQELYERARDLLQLEKALETFRVGGNSSSPQSTKGVPQGDKKPGSTPPVGKK